MAAVTYRNCAVPFCRNTTIKTPSKLFIHVPKTAIRKKWLQLARRNPEGLSQNSTLYFCEDHFDLPNDMENYMRYIIMGSVRSTRLKPSCLPSKFECQPDRVNTKGTSKPRPAALKRQRSAIIKEILEQYDKTVSTSNLELRTETAKVKKKPRKKATLSNGIPFKPLTDEVPTHQSTEQSHREYYEVPCSMVQNCEQHMSVKVEEPSVSYQEDETVFIKIEPICELEEPEWDNISIEDHTVYIKIESMSEVKEEPV